MRVAAIAPRGKCQLLELASSVILILASIALPLPSSTLIDVSATFPQLQTVVSEF